MSSGCPSRAASEAAGGAGGMQEAAQCSADDEEERLATPMVSLSCASGEDAPLAAPGAHRRGVCAAICCAIRADCGRRARTTEPC
jgi:hypothetical protein